MQDQQKGGVRKCLSNTSPSALLPNKKNVNSLWGKREVAGIRETKQNKTQKVTKKKNRKNLNDIWLDSIQSIKLESGGHHKYHQATSWV